MRRRFNGAKPNTERADASAQHWKYQIPKPKLQINPKSEYRNTKQYQKLKIQMTKTFLNFENLNIWICPDFVEDPRYNRDFGFRASCLEFICYLVFGYWCFHCCAVAGDGVPLGEWANDFMCIAYLSPARDASVGKPSLNRALPMLRIGNYKFQNPNSK